MAARRHCPALPCEPLHRRRARRSPRDARHTARGMDPRRPRYGFSLAELVAGDMSSTSSESSGEAEDDEEEEAGGSENGSHETPPDATADEPLYDAGMDAKDEAWVSRKFLGGQPDLFQRLSCPGCFAIVCFDAAPTDGRMCFTSTKAVNCTVDRRLPCADGSFMLACRECGAHVGRVLAEGKGYVFESVLGSMLEV